MKKLARLTTLFNLILIFQSCSSNKQTMPPSEDFLNDLRHKNYAEYDKKIQNLTDSENQALVYSKGLYFKEKNNLKHACQRFRYLKSDERFPLKTIALIRSIENCRYSKTNLQLKWKHLEKEIPEWAYEEYVRVSLKEALRVKDHHYIAVFSKIQTKFEKIKKDREILLQQAIAHSKMVDNKELVEEYIRALEEAAPRFKKDVKPDEYYTVGRDFESARNFSKARNFYLKIINSQSFSVSEKIRAWNRLAMSHKIERNKDKYTEQSKRISDWLRNLRKKDPSNIELKDMWVESVIQYARAIWTQNNIQKGRQALNKLIGSNIQNENQNAMIYWLLGAMALEEGKISIALSNYKEASKFKTTDKELHDKINWSIGWNLYLKMKYAEAADHFRISMEETDNFFVKKKLLFWEAKSRIKAGNKDVGESILKNLAEDNPFNYYGIIANIELNGNFDPLNAKSELNGKHDSILNWLIAVNEDDLAKSYLDHIDDNARDPEAIADLLPLYARAKWYEGGIIKFFKLNPEERDKMIEAHVLSAFPKAYEDSFNNVSEKYGVDKNILYSITRQESAFNPTIRSWADAFGLMQLTPERAESLSKEYGIPYGKKEDLYDETTNMSMGAILVKNLQEKFQNKFIGFVASYNSNPRTVINWKKSRYRKDPIEFIEMIPYEETQNYVKLVLRNYITYRRLNSQKSFQITRSFFL